MAESSLVRGTIIDVNLDPTLGSETGKIRPAIIVTNNVYNEKVPVIQVVPITGWSEKKASILTNVVIDPNFDNGLTKKSVCRRQRYASADCLQTRPIDKKKRIIKIRGVLTDEIIIKIDRALKIVFQLE